LTTLLELIRKAKKLGYVEKELKRNKESMHLRLKISDEHVDFYKDQLKTEQTKGEIGNMVKSALK
jgi:hypothetical protein